MTQLIAQDGTVEPVTLLSVDNNVIIAKRTTETDGYDADVIGAGATKKQSKPVAGIVKASKANPAIIKEIRVSGNPSELNVGEQIKADVFTVGDKVDVTGISKGKGWAGTIKRHNFHRGRKTHGGRSYRRVGSIGSMYPQHILKGKKMAGRMGNAKTTTKGLRVALIDQENNYLGVIGSVPGPKKGTVIVREAK